MILEAMASGSNLLRAMPIELLLKKPQSKPRLRNSERTIRPELGPRRQPKRTHKRLWKMLSAGATVRVIKVASLGNGLSSSRNRGTKSNRGFSR